MSFILKSGTPDASRYAEQVKRGTVSERHNLEAVAIGDVLAVKGINGSHPEYNRISNWFNQRGKKVKAKTICGVMYFTRVK